MVELVSSNGEANEPLSITPVNCDDSEISEKNLAKPADSSKYDPHEHGNKNRPVFQIEATLLLLKYIIGAGILALPYSFSKVGYLIGIIGTILISLLYLHIVHLLLQLEYDHCKRLQVPQLTYVGVVKQTFEQSSTRVRPLRPYFLAMMYFNYSFSSLLYNAVCLITMASNLHSIFNHQETISASSMQYYLTLIIIPLTLICWIPNLKFLVPFSVLTAALTMFNVAIILFLGTSEGSPTHIVGDLHQFPSFFAIVVGAFSCTGLILPLKNDMAKPKSFTSTLGVLNVSVLLVSGFYAFFGTAAYFKYGGQTQGNILSNLPGGQLLSIVVYVSYTVAMGISYTYSFYISFDTLWSNYLGAMFDGKRYQCLAKYSIKTVISALTYGLAVVIPNFELFATLSGCLGIFMDIGLPAVLQMLMFTREELTMSKVLIVVKNSVIVLIALVMFFSSLYTSLKAIIGLYWH